MEPEQPIWHPKPEPINTQLEQKEFRQQSSVKQLKIPNKLNEKRAKHGFDKPKHKRHTITSQHIRKQSIPRVKYRNVAPVLHLLPLLYSRIIHELASNQVSTGFD